MSSAKEAATAAVELAKEKADAISKKKDDVESYIMHKLRAPKCVDDFLLVKQNVGEILTSIKDAADRQKVIKSKKRKIDEDDNNINYDNDDSVYNATKKFLDDLTADRQKVIKSKKRKIIDEDYNNINCDNDNDNDSVYNVTKKFLDDLSAVYEPQHEAHLAHKKAKKDELSALQVEDALARQALDAAQDALRAARRSAFLPLPS